MGFHKFRKQKVKICLRYPFSTPSAIWENQNIKSPMKIKSTSLSRPETGKRNDFDVFNEEGYLSISSNLHILQVFHWTDMSRDDGSSKVTWSATLQSKLDEGRLYSPMENRRGYGKNGAVLSEQRWDVGRVPSNERYPSVSQTVIYSPFRCNYPRNPAWKIPARIKENLRSDKREFDMFHEKSLICGPRVDLPTEDYYGHWGT